MAADTIISLIQAIMKLAPEIINIIEGLIGHGNTIAPEQLPHLLTQAIEISKNQSAAAVSVAQAPVETASIASESAEPIA